MKYDPETHHRRSIRLEGHDYSGGGCYFVTICAHRSAGKVFANEPAAQVIDECWKNIPSHYPEAIVKDFVVMPDHFHGIIEIGARHASPVRDGAPMRSLGNIVGSFKSAVSRELHRIGERQASPVRNAQIPKEIWQRNYYEKIVRSHEAAEKIVQYIRLNPWKCITDFGDGLRGLGNPALWQCEKLGVLCSRNAPKIGCIPDADVYLGGWHSPKEKEILDWLLKQKKKIIICPAWRIDSILNEKNRDKFSLLIGALEENRILIIEMPDKEGNLVAAEGRNRFVVKHADSLFTPYVKKGGMLERILKGNTT